MDVDDQASVYIQWKGTGEICMDFRCICGAMPHVHGDFAYAVRCAQCGKVWMMPTDFRLQEADPSYDGCMIQAWDDSEWYAKCIFNIAPSGQTPTPCGVDAVSGTDYCAMHRNPADRTQSCAEPPGNTLLSRPAEPKES